MIDLQNVQKVLGAYLNHRVLQGIMLGTLQLQLEHRREILKQDSSAGILQQPGTGLCMQL